MNLIFPGPYVDTHSVQLAARSCVTRDSESLLTASVAATASQDSDALNLVVVYVDTLRTHG